MTDQSKWTDEMSRKKQAELEASKNPKTQRRPIQVGEQFPWKGFFFVVKEVTKTGFTAEVCGVTKRLQHLVEA